MNGQELPQIIKEVGFDFNWDEEKVWTLSVPTENMPIEELYWHFDIPFLWSHPDGFYDVTPREVIENPGIHALEFGRTLNADTGYPIDIMFWRGRWVILDGLHRLMRLSMDGFEVIKVRKIPVTAIPDIQK